MRVNVGQEILRRVDHVFVVEPARSCVSDKLKRMNS